MSRVALCQFRVYAGETEGQGLFVYARIFRRKADMLTVLRMESKTMVLKEGFPNKTMGAMQAFKHYPRGAARPTACFGRVNLCRKYLGTEVVTHEFTHAMFAWAWRKKLIAGLAGMPVEEQCCYALGRMLRRFVARTNKLGLYQED
jgi:hypothetical protein